VLRDGQEVASAEATMLDPEVEEPGAYRADARRMAHGRRAHLDHLEPHMTMRFGENLEVLRRRDFRLLLLGEGVSVLGDRMVAVALAFAVIHLGGSASEVGLVGPTTGPGRDSSPSRFVEQRPGGNRHGVSRFRPDR
jgi:hypothetical protein